MGLLHSYLLSGFALYFLAAFLATIFLIAWNCVTKKDLQNSRMRYDIKLCMQIVASCCTYIQQLASHLVL